MLQWMGGARRKMKATKDSKLKRQLEFFDYRKERRKRKDIGEEPGKLHTLADYIRQNLHGGESLDILGLRSLNPTSVDVNIPANSDANLQDPATAVFRPEPGDAGGVTAATSNVSASSVGALKGDDQDTSPQQPECQTKSPRIIQEQKQERDAYGQRKLGVADATQQEIKKLVNRNTELPLLGKGINPVHVGNLQTKKVASTPRLILSDMILSDNKGDSRGKKRPASEVYAIFSQDGMNAIDESIFDGVVQHPQQQTFVTSDSIADWDDTEELLTSSLQLNSSNDCHPESPVNGTSELLSRFLSTQKLKNFKGISPLQHGRQPQEYNITGKDFPFKREFLLNSFRSTHSEDQNVGFSNPTFNTTNGQVKEPREINISKAMFDVEEFHVKQEPEEFDMSDPFATVTSCYVKQEHQDSGFSDPLAITKKGQAKQERQEYDYVNLGFNTGDHEVAQECSFLPDLSYDQDAFKVDSNFFNRNKGSSNPENDLVTWDFDPQRNASSIPSCLKREFPGLDYFRSVQVTSCGGSPSDSFRQFKTLDNIPDANEKFYPHLDNRDRADMKFDKLRLPLDNYEVETQHTEAAFSSLHDYSPRRMKINRSNFENEAPDWDVVLHKKCTFSDQWNCEPSVAWDVARRQENTGPIHSGGYSGQTRNHNNASSWSQTIAEGTAKYFTDYLTGDINGMKGASPRRDLMQAKDLSSETQAIIAPEILQDAKPLFLPQINSGNEDCIIVCFPDNEDSPNVDAKSIHLPIQSINIPLQLFGTVDSSSRIVHDINVLSPETPLNRISQEIDDSLVAGEVVTAAKAMTIAHKKLILGQEDSACNTILTSNRQSRKDHLLVLNSVSSFNRDTEIVSWQVKDPQREAYSAAQPPKTRRATSNLLAMDEARNIEDGLEHHSSNSDKADQCFSLDVLHDHYDDRAVQHEMMHNVQENSLEVCTPLKKIFQEDMNGMSTTKAEGMLKKRLRAKNAHDYCCQASFSSQEECSPAFQHNTVQAVLCKLQRPVCSCSSKQGKLSEHGIKNVDTVLLKLQRSTRPSDSGLGYQDAEGNQILQKDIKRTSDMNQKSNLELEIEPTAECDLRSLTEQSERGLSDIIKQKNKEARLSLDDIDAIASSSHRVSIQPYQRGSGLKAHLLMSALQMKEVPKSSVPVGNTLQHPTPVSQRKQILVVLEEEQPYPRISDPLVRDAKEDCAQVSQRNPISVVRDKERSQLKDSDPLAPHAGVLEFPSNTPQVSERQKVILEASQEQLGLDDTQHNLASTENVQQDGGGTTTTTNMTNDAAYVKMLESYVVQLKLENNVLRLSTGS